MTTEFDSDDSLLSSEEELDDNSHTKVQVEDNSSEPLSSGEELEERPRKVVTQNDVFGSDTESEHEHPEKKASKDNESHGTDASDLDSDEHSNNAPNSNHSRTSDSDESPGITKQKSESLKHHSRRQQLDSDHDEPPQTAARSPDDNDSDNDDASQIEEDVDEIEQQNENDESEPQADENDEQNQEPDETRIAVDFPLIRADLGREMHLVKMPNFLSVETRPFDPNFYEVELDEDEILDEEGRTRLKLKVENTIRWRVGKTPDGQMVHESNARIVRWSDGSLSLHLGEEIFDIHKVDIQSDYNYLFIREGSGLQGQSSLRTKLIFRPHSTDSFTHRKMALSLADKTSKSQKVKILPIAGADPESNREALVRKEEEKLRATLRRDSQIRRMREKQAMSRSSHSGERRRSYNDNIDYDDDDDENTTSLNALKRNAKNAFNASRKDVSAVYSSDSESLSDLSDIQQRKKVRARISDEDESA